MSVTKLFTQAISYNMPGDTTARINTKGYKSAKVVITIDTPSSGSLSFNVKNDKDEKMLLLNDTLGSVNEVVIDYRGGNFKQEYLIDLTATQSCVVKYSGALVATKATAEIFFSYDEVGKIFKGNVFDIFDKGSAVIDVKDKLCKFTFSVEADTMSTNPTIVIGGTADNETWTNAVQFIHENTEKNSINATPGVEYCLWLNTESYKKIRIKCNNTINQHVGVRYSVEQLPSFEREIKMLSTNNNFTNYGGGKNIMLKFDNMAINNGAGNIRVYAKNAQGNYMNPRLYTLDGKPIMRNVTDEYSFVSAEQSYFILNINGDVLNGGLILKYDEPFTSESKFNYVIGSAKIVVDGDAVTHTKKVSVVISDDDFEPVAPKEELLIARNDYDIYNIDIEGKIVDAVNEDVLIKTGTNTFKYCEFGLYGLIYDVVLDAAHCPSLITGENVKFVKLVNYENKSFNFSRTRILLFTDKNRILYNRVKQDAIGISYFREAPLYNMKKKFYPVNSKSAASTVAKYLPIYPDYDYNQFDGRVDGTDAFGLALPSRENTLSDGSIVLLEDWRKYDELGKVAYSTFVLSNALGCIFGQYNSGDGDPWVAVSSNGKEFFIIETWACVEDYTLAGITTTKVDLSTIISNAGGYTSGSLKLTRRLYNVPNSTTKEPATPFIIGDSCVVSSISVENNHTYISFVDDSAFAGDEITQHRFNNMAPVVFFENVSASSEYDYICNSVKADGSDNTGIFFRLHRISNNRYELFADAGDPFQGYNVCRHIHSVSEHRGGILVATGENYRHLPSHPNDVFFDGGFLYYITADSKFNPKPIQYTLNDVMTYFFGTTRVTSSEKAINRACGAVMRGDNKIIFTSDSVQGDRDVNNIQIEGRTETIDSKSYGIYMGDAKDCDDWSKYKCVCNVYDAGLGLVEHLGRLAFCGYAGPVHFSTDFGETWHTENIARDYRSNPEVGSVLDVTGLANDGSIYYGNNKIVFKV